MGPGREGGLGWWKRGCRGRGKGKLGWERARERDNGRIDREGESVY